MKSTGIVRKIDELGRLVLPKELRKTLQIAHEDPIEIYVEGESIILKKYQPCCIFCGNAENLVDFSSKKICKDCAETIYEKAEEL